MKKNNYKLKKKYVAGTQSLDPNIDPTTQYQNNRDKNSGSVKDMEFNNSQQSLANRGVIQQQQSDKTNQANQNFQNVGVQDQKNHAAIGAIGSAAFAVNPIVGGAIIAANTITSATDKNRMKRMQQTGNVNAGLGDAVVSDVLNPLGAGLNLLEGNSAKKEFLAAQQQKKQQTNINSQISKYGAVDTSSQATQIKKGSSGIYINPENKGKFNATKKATGETTEELTHSSNLITKKRAVFAQNASHWNHKKDGSKDLVLNNLIKGHSKSYKMIEKKESPKIEKQELTEFKKLKNLESSKTREIETEGREPIFSPKKKDGTRDLLYYDPTAPNHEQGGVKAKVVKSNNYAMKSGNSKLTIPEGSAIVTANKGKNKEALIAYKKGDYKKLNKVIDKMPDDSKSKKDNGDNYVNADSVNKPNNSYGFGDYSSNDRVSEQQPKKDYSSTLNKVAGGLNSLGSLSPSLYNIGQGLSKAQTVNRRYVNNENYKYTDTSAPAIRAANEQQLVSFNNIRNSGGSFLANQAVASSDRFKNISDINNQQMAQKTDINNFNVDLRNAQNQTNSGLANEYDKMDRDNRSKKTEYIGKGLEGLSEYSQMNQLNKNRGVSDNATLNTLKTNNYSADKSGNIITNHKKGLKNIKYKMKQ